MTAIRMTSLVRNNMGLPRLLAELLCDKQRGNAKKFEIFHASGMLRPPRSPKMRRAGARVLRRFRLARRNRLHRFLECRLRRCRLRQMPRLRLRAGTRLEEALDDPVFERMEGNDCKHAARLQKPLCGEKRPCELAQFVIDENAKPLEDAGGRMDLVCRLVTYGAFDQVRQIARRLERLVRPPLLDGTGDAAGMPLLA